jgi:hypothetical protein
LGGGHPPPFPPPPRDRDHRPSHERDESLSRMRSQFWAETGTQKEIGDSAPNEEAPQQAVLSAPQQ